MIRVKQVMKHFRDALEKRVGESLADWIWKSLLTLPIWSLVPLGCRVMAFGDTHGDMFKASLWLSALGFFILVGFFGWKARQQMATPKAQPPKKGAATMAIPQKQGMKAWAARLLIQVVVSVTVVFIVMGGGYATATYLMIPSVHLHLYPRSAASKDRIFIIAVQGHETIQRTLANGNGFSVMGWVKRTVTEYYAIRISGNVIEWSKQVTEGGMEDIHFLNFPEYRHEMDEFDPIKFSETNDVLNQTAGQVVHSISAELEGVEEELLFISRTSKTPEPDPTTFDNYGLSNRRGSNSRVLFAPGIPLTQMKVLPLDYQVPLQSESGTLLDNDEQRSVRVTRLRKIYDPRAGQRGADKRQTGKNMVYQEPAETCPAENIDIDD